MTNYNLLLEQPEMGQTLNPHISSHTHILGHANHNSTMLVTRKQRFLSSKPVSKVQLETLAVVSSPSLTARETLSQQFRNSVSSLFSRSNQCPSVLSEKANYGAEFVLPSPHFWIHSFKVGRKKTFGQ